MPTPRELVAAYGREYDLTRRQMQQLLRVVWRDVGGPGQANLDELLSIVLPILQGAQMNVAQLVTAFADAISTEFGVTLSPPAPNPLRVSGAFLRNGTPPAQVYERAVVDVRRELAKQRGIVDARAAGRRRLLVLADTDLALTHRVAAGDAFDALGFQRYRRVPTGRSCDLCRTAAAHTYNVGYLLPIHPHCDCRVLPLYEGRKIPTRDLPDLPEPTATVDPVVREHGELGPVLVEGSHRFTAEHDLGS